MQVVLDLEAKMEAPKQASWMVRKFFNVRNHWAHIGNGMRSRFLISAAYKNLRGDVENVNWRSQINHNVACPKQVFILWLLQLFRILNAYKYTYKIGRRRC